MSIVEKYFRAAQDTGGSMAHALCVWIPQATDTHTKYVILNCFSAAAKIARMHLSVNVYTNLGCLFILLI